MVLLEARLPPPAGDGWERGSGRRAVAAAAAHTMYDRSVIKAGQAPLLHQGPAYLCRACSASATAATEAYPRRPPKLASATQPWTGRVGRSGGARQVAPAGRPRARQKGGGVQARQGKAQGSASERAWAGASSGRGVRWRSPVQPPVSVSTLPWPARACRQYIRAKGSHAFLPPLHQVPPAWLTRPTRPCSRCPPAKLPPPPPLSPASVAHKPVATKFARHVARMSYCSKLPHIPSWTPINKDWPSGVKQAPPTSPNRSTVCLPSPTTPRDTS